MWRLVSAGVLAVGLAGCGTHNLGSVRTTTSSAEERITFVSQPGVPPRSGRPAEPQQIFCAEPSPDVAKAVSAATNISASLDAQASQPQTGTNVAGAAAVAASRSRAEALAQLTERLATVQLLRDGLYRACEAFANGAVGPISYAMMLSRYGDTMVTLLGSEMAAGAFGRQLAALGTSSGGDAQAALQRAREANGQVTATTQQIRDAEKRLSDLEGKTQELATAREDARAAVVPDANGAIPTAATARRAGAEAAYDQHQRAMQETRSELAALRAKLDSDLSARASANAAAQSLSPAGPITGSQRSNDAGQVLLAMQRGYMADGDLSALSLACVTALQQSTAPVPRDGGQGSVLGSFTELAALCGGRDGLMRMLTQTAVKLNEQRAALAQTEAERARAEAERARLVAERQLAESRLALLRQERQAPQPGRTP
jgi:predicted  nucleic acid-binding Zn-ribbon protein